MARRSSPPPPPGWNGQCLSKAHRTGEQCRNRALPPTTRCKRHGGMSLRGPAHPRFKHGRDSSLMQALPKHMREVFGKTMKRDDLVHLRGEISLLEAREVELLQQLQGGGSEEFWKKIRKLRHEHDELCRDLEDRRSGAGGEKWDQEAIDRAQSKIDRVTEQILLMIDTGAHDAGVWREILEAVEMRRRLSDTERRRLEMLQAFLTPDQAMAFALHLVAIVRDVVEDKRQLSAIVARVQQLLPGGNAAEDREEVIDVEMV